MGPLKEIPDGFGFLGVFKNFLQAHVPPVGSKMGRHIARHTRDVHSGDAWSRCGCDLHRMTDVVSGAVAVVLLHAAWTAMAQRRKSKNPQLKINYLAYT